MSLGLTLTGLLIGGCFSAGPTEAKTGDEGCVPGTSDGCEDGEICLEDQRCYSLCDASRDCGASEYCGEKDALSGVCLDYAATQCDSEAPDPCPDFEGYYCSSGICTKLPAWVDCGNRTQDGDETAVDCGGAYCPSCEAGEGCAQPGDCASGVCTGGICMEPACDDSVMNGDESDMDCGGSCPGCDPDERCLAHDDCDSRVCSEENTCVAPACTDKVRNGDESDIDCGGSCDPCLPGESCGDGMDCDSGVCGAGVCGQWTDRERIDQAVWADDDSGHAFVVWRYQENFDETRDHSWQLYVQNVDGSDRRSLTSPQPHAFGSALYYMKAAGYVLAEIIESSTQIRYDVIRLDSTVATFKEWTVPDSPCASLEIVPSPDGLRLGLMKRRASDDCGSGLAEGALYDPTTLAAYAHYSWSVSGAAESTWTPAGEFLIRDDSSARRLDRYGGPIPVGLPGCVYPKTTSSTIAATGLEIEPGPGLGNPVVEAASDATPFGCQ